jgi:hypothetical protein
MKNEGGGKSHISQLDDSNIRWLFRKTVQQGRRQVKSRGVPSGYVEDLNEARTPLAALLNSLNQQGCPLKTQGLYRAMSNSMSS